MREIEFKLDFENFYCPITGEQVLDPGQFNPSPAMVFLFLHPNRVFEYLRPDLKEKFKDLWEKKDHGKLYLKLTDNELAGERNYWWITHGGPPFGCVSMCFDMGYKID